MTASLWYEALARAVPPEYPPLSLDLGMRSALYMSNGTERKSGKGS